MIPAFDQVLTEPITLRPLFDAEWPDIHALLTGIRGSFKDPKDPSAWYLVVRPSHTNIYRNMREQGQPVAQVRIKFVLGAIQVDPFSASEEEMGMGQRVLAILLTFGPWELEVWTRKRKVEYLSDVFPQTYPDPDDPADATEEPPRVGQILRLAREDHDDELLVHNNGAVSYERSGGGKIYRRLAPEVRDWWPERTAKLPMTQDQFDDLDEFQQTVVLSRENPDVRDDIVKLDAARPLPEHREVLSLMLRWIQALAADPDAMPAGLVAK
jgi:hypothetical protein